MKKKNRNSLLTLLVSSFVLATVAFSFLFFKDMKQLNEAYEDLNNIAFISSGTQRIISLALTNQLLESDVFFIGDSTQKSFTLNGEDALSLLHDSNIVIVAKEVLSSWTQIEELLMETFEGGSLDEINLAIARESHFKSMTNLTNAVSEKTQVLNDRIAQYQLVVMILLFVIGMATFNNLLQTHAELKISRAMADSAQIDTSTGLYNRSKCQDLFKTNPSESKQPAILVLDLNDLKKTNDSLGHRVGDELIQNFATALKGATEVHVLPPFIGRYGGDEFVVYYDNVADEGEIKTFLKELDFLTEAFNVKESRFRISYAVGYSILPSTAEEKLSTRQLFDLADEAMYADKAIKKRGMNPNYDPQTTNQ